VAKRTSGETVGILPLVVSRRGTVRLVRLIGSGPSDELGPLCSPGDLEAVAASLRHHVIETVGDSGIFLGERLAGDNGTARMLGDTVVDRDASPVLPIAGRSFEGFLASRSRNLRSQIYRGERKLARDFKLRYRLTSDPQQLEHDLQTLMRLHAARWGDGSSRAFAGHRGAFHVDFARQALANGWLRLWIMELDHQPVAAWYGFRFSGLESYYQAGRDPAFAAYKVGFILLCHTIRCAFDDGLREYRFGLGDEPYKGRFAERDPGLDTVAFAAGARGRLALAGIRAALRMPAAVRRGRAWRTAIQIARS
jgi:CelD/BcsL family acetyltransferase involved in cellulose biosynthesis